MKNTELGYFEKKCIFYDAVTNEHVFSWVGNFAGNHGKVTQKNKCQMSTSSSKTCYSTVFIKKMNEKAYLKTRKPPSLMFFCENLKFLQTLQIVIASCKKLFLQLNMLALMYHWQTVSCTIEISLNISVRKLNHCQVNIWYFLT